MNSVLKILLLVITYAVTAAMLSVVGLLVVRLILHWADVNPFNKIALWTRRLTDPLLSPTQSQMRMMGIDPKFAPLVVLLLTLLGGFFCIRAAENVSVPLDGAIWTLGSKLFVSATGFLLCAALRVYSFIILARILLSWIWTPRQNKLMRFLARLADPLIELIRQWLGPSLRRYQSYGSPDWSGIVAPLLALVLVYVVQRVVAWFFGLERYLFG